MLLMPRFVLPGQIVNISCSGRLGKTGVKNKKVGEVMLQMKSNVGPKHTYKLAITF